MQTPDGAVTTLEIRSLDVGRYYIAGERSPVAGVYELDGDVLRMTEPDNPRMGEMAWELGQDGTLVLISAPPVQLAGQRLISAVLYPK